MQLAEHLRLMAQYNQWMNAKVYDAAATLSAEELAKNRGAFFGSILGTLNHIAIGDILWLKRFTGLLATHSELDFIRACNQPQALDETLFSTLEELYACRKQLDNVFVELANSMTVAELDQSVSYHNMKGIPATKNSFSLLMHLFNHQTHHRGQVTTLLFQAGVDVGVTDLLAVIPNS
jgi:uncharacterized damage-inducible protein DinB